MHTDTCRYVVKKKDYYTKTPVTKKNYAQNQSKGQHCCTCVPINSYPHSESYELYRSYILYVVSFSLPVGAEIPPPPAFRRADQPAIAYKTRRTNGEQLHITLFVNRQYYSGGLGRLGYYSSVEKDLKVLLTG